MKYISIAPLLLVAHSDIIAAASSSPWPPSSGGWRGVSGHAGSYGHSGSIPCLSPNDANDLILGYAGLLTNYSSSAAEALLTEDFTDESDSINILAGVPLGGMTMSNRAAFEASQGPQPSIGFQLDAIDAVTCNTVAYRWTAAVGSKQMPVKGINTMTAVQVDNKWMISKVYSEFNTAAWIQDIGGKVSMPQSSSTGS